MYKPIPNVKVVALGHKARNGKDTTAAVFQDYFGSLCRRYAFADAMKAICRAEHGMTVKDAPLLQRMGTDVYRQKNEFVWTDTLYWTIDEQRPLVAVITDCRFPNEAEMVKAMGGVLVDCQRFFGGRRYVDPSRDPRHASETALDGYTGWDYTIQAATVAVLEYQALNIVHTIAEEIGYVSH
jgi:hypothetical protein